MVIFRGQREWPNLLLGETIGAREKIPDSSCSGREGEALGSEEGEHGYKVDFIGR
jgi:hypothetical protein